MEWSDFVKIVEIPLLIMFAGIVMKMWLDLSKHQLHVAENYAKREDIEKSELKIYTVLERIEQKIDRNFEKAMEKRIP